MGLMCMLLQLVSTAIESCLCECIFFWSLPWGHFLYYLIAMVCFQTSISCCSVLSAVYLGLLHVLVLVKVIYFLR